MEYVFNFLCGILYLIGLPFGLSYQETSIYVCIYLWPTLCTISTIPILVVSISKIKYHIITGIVLSIISLIYSAYYVYYTNLAIETYNICDKNSFMKCMLDLKFLAEYLNVSYAELNLFIYVIGFGLIIGFNLIIAFLLKKLIK